MANLNVRVDDKVKENAENLFESLGMNMTTAINIFLKQAIRVNGIPFRIRADVPNNVTLSAFEEGKRLISNKDSLGYKDIESLKKALDL